MSRRQLNVVPLGALLSGTVNGINLAVPANRVALDASVVNTFRPFQVYPGIQDWSFEGESDYNSLQVTLSRQTGRRLQYFAAYTYARSKGTTSGNGEYGFIDPFDASRTYGVLPEDRTHIFNLSWNAFLPDGARGRMDNAFGRGLLNGWQLSGISTLASGVPIFLGFGGQAGSDGVTQAIFGTPDIIGNPGPGGGDRGGLAPIYTCDPRTGNTGLGEKILDINCIQIPAFGENGPLVPPYNLRMPTRINHDLTLFKNFELTGTQKIQFRVGFFNIFNQAWITTNSAADVDLVLDTVCNVTLNGVANGAGGVADNVCDPASWLPVHADREGQLREDQPEEGPAGRGVRAEVLLLTRDNSQLPIPNPQAVLLGVGGWELGVDILRRRILPRRSERVHVPVFSPSSSSRSSVSRPFTPRLPRRRSSTSWWRKRFSSTRRATF